MGAVPKGVNALTKTHEDPLQCGFDRRFTELVGNGFASYGQCLSQLALGRGINHQSEVHDEGSVATRAGVLRNTAGQEQRVFEEAKAPF